jgi:hypothetical protein
VSLTPLIQEMVTVYHDEERRPDMAHWRLEETANLVMESSSTDSIHFDSTDSSGVDPAEDAHMHALTVRFIGKDTIEQEWVMYQVDQPVVSKSFRLQRTEQL